MTILEVEVEERDALVRVALKGELDLSTVGKVEDELERVEAGDPPLVALDLTRLAFLDSTGLRLVLSSAERARERGGRFVIVKGPDPVQRVFEITRLDERLEMVDDVSALSTSG